MNKETEYIVELLKSSNLSETELNINIQKVNDIHNNTLQYLSELTQNKDDYTLNFNKIVPDIIEILFFDFNLSDSFIANLFNVDKKMISNYRKKYKLSFKRIYTKRVTSYKEMNYNEFLENLKLLN